MTDRPITFTAEAVRAILAGRKTQTRRWPVRWLTVEQAAKYDPARLRIRDDNERAPAWAQLAPYAVGDLLWVREAWQPVGDEPLSECADADDIDYYASANAAEKAIFKWRPSIHMPRWASRITLRVTAVRIERLQEISEADALAEGMARYPLVASSRRDFIDTWERLNAKRAPWASNPWVVAITFERI